MATRLYIKQHSITGLKYFGKTTQDPYEYLGSGLVWTRHIKKHGVDHVKTIWVSDPFNDNETLKEFAEFLSEELDVVNSKDWANLVPENGISGGAIRTGAILSEETKNKLRQKATGRKQTEETKYKMSIAHTGKVQTDKQKQAMREYNLSRTLPSLECPHCNKVGSYVAMHRWHFDKCKLRAKEN